MTVFTGETKKKPKKPLPKIRVTAPTTARPVVSTAQRPATRIMSAPRSTTQGWQWPVPGTNVFQGVSEQHTALDITGRIGDPVVSPVAGTVRRLLWQPNGYGLNVRLTTPEGYDLIFGHLNAYVQGLAEGQEIQAGQLLGLLGSTGMSTGPHLHLEVRQPGFSVDRFLPGHSAGVGAIDPGQFFRDISPASSARPALSTANFRFAPTTQPQVPLAGTTPGPYPGQPSGFAMATGTPLQTTAEILSGLGAKTGTKTSEAPQGILVGNLGLFGPVTIPAPGALAIRWGFTALGLLLIVISLYILAVKTTYNVTQPIRKGLKGASDTGRKAQLAGAKKAASLVKGAAGA